MEVGASSDSLRSFVHKVLWNFRQQMEKITSRDVVTCRICTLSGHGVCDCEGTQTDIDKGIMAIIKCTRYLVNIDNKM